MDSAIVRISTAAWTRNIEEMEGAVKHAVMLHMEAISQQEQTIDDLTEDNDILESNAKELETRNRELEDRNRELEDRNRELERNLKKMGKTLTKLRLELQTLKKQSAPEPAQEPQINLWPTNLKDFYMALSIAPEQSVLLNELLETVKEGMEAKDRLEEKMCAWHVDRGIDYVASPQWPINLTTYLCVLPSCPEISHLWKKAQDGFLAKGKLDILVKDIIKKEFSL